MKKPTHLLTEAEIKYIETDGLGFGTDEDFIYVGAEEAVLMTLKGRAAFQYAIEYHGHPGKLSDIHTLREFRKFQITMEMAVLRTLKRELREFQSNCADRNKDRAVVEAVLHGSPVQVLETLSHSLELRRAGPNVSLLPIQRHGQVLN